MLQTNISNLAGVPSIIYGIFGLALFVRLMRLGPTVLSGALTLTLLILPIVIIARIEALKAVPQAQREGAYALGASRWQMVTGSVMPAAAPGIMTGIILAMARAIGETAPLILVGAATFVAFVPHPLQGQFTVLPIQVFDWATRPQAEFQGITSATIIVILVLIFLLNVLALIVGTAFRDISSGRGGSRAHRQPGGARPGVARTMAPTGSAPTIRIAATERAPFGRPVRAGHRAQGPVLLLRLVPSRPERRGQDPEARGSPP